jgi:predicted amidohydrolase YtcJ
VPRFAALGVAASIQPVWIAEGSPWNGLGPRLGAERLARLYPWKWLADAGATLLFGSDMPSSVQDDPIAGISGATTRITASSMPFLPEQAIEASIAMRSFTAAPAKAIGAGAWLGELAPGYVADLVLLAEDPRAGARSLAEDPIVAMWIDGAAVTP